MSSMSLSLALVPRDGFFFKDGRGWYTSDTNRAGALSWPFPSTVRGALTTACGYCEQEETKTILIPDQWLALKKQVTISALLPLRRKQLEESWEPRHRLWPVPRDAQHGRGGVVRLEPRPADPAIQSMALGDGDDAGALQALWHPQPTDPMSGGKPTEPPAWWSDDTFVQWLCGEVPTHEAVGEHGALRMERRPDVKVVIKPNDLTAKDGGLFAYEVLEALTKTHQWAVGVRGVVPASHKGFTDHPMTLGGKGRITQLEPTAASIWDFPEALGEAFAKAARCLRLVLVTPGHFEGGWCLPGFRARGEHFVGALPGVDGELVLRAAIVPRALHVSGWDRARNEAKATRRLVAPGSVYYLHKKSGAAISGAEARALWLTALGEDLEDGLGRVVPGIWNPDRRTAETIMRRDIP